MKRAVIFVLVVAVLVGLGYIGLSSQSTTAYDDSDFYRDESRNTKLVRIAEDITLEPGKVFSPMRPGEVFSPRWLDVKSYRQFKLYVRMTPYEGGPREDPGPPPDVSVLVIESPVGAVGQRPYGRIPFEWEAFPAPPDLPPEGSHWGIAAEFDGLYSKMSVAVINAGPSATTRTISVYLLMAEE